MGHRALHPFQDPPQWSPQIPGFSSTLRELRAGSRDDKTTPCKASLPLSETEERDPDGQILMAEGNEPQVR